jgi:hypothetical protein
LKWLLNERAAVAGEVNKAAMRSQALAAKMATLQRELKNLHHRLQSVSNVQDARRATLNAMDTAIGLAYRNVRADTGGVVNAQAGKYGLWGGLTDFVVQTLKDASPTPVSGRQLIAGVISHFQIVIVVPAERRSVKTSVRSALSQLVKQGLVRPAYSGEEPMPGLWRWKQPDTLADLAVKAAAIARAAADEAARAGAGSPGTSDSHAP